ncbi:MAG: sodium:solute symporter [Melioribacteraceae bacterium]|nr:sodium:solute symporter [Melioribacteraceae bacterium]MCF8353473.1 sodium:solute symporter [Melioribacteraceae bacterium]MCF8392602.1 sodium:solute symporter [Melioribacteraceae bacterium]MCF8418526.1 sodium:solute symporter [Melioribacteraceae bacterium]
MASSIDYFIIAAYLISIAVFGIVSGGKQKSVSDYFLGSKKVPWWAVCFSIVAAETSTLTFISIPGLAYIGNFNFLQVTLGYLIGRILVAAILLPAYFKGELSTAYAFLETRFGSNVRSFSSVIFLFTRVAADGVRLFATAIPLKLLLDISYPAAIIIIAVVSLIYTYTGGVRGVIWVDVVQMFIYLGGAAVSLIFLSELLPNGFSSIWDSGLISGKMEIINFGFDLSFIEFIKTPYTLLGGIVGGAFLSMASHGTDQLIIQRLLTTKELISSKKAVIASGLIIIFQFALFLFVGLGLYTFYGNLDVNPDEIFPKFIIESLPQGVSGIIIAGLFAAAMSTLAGSMSSLSSSSMLDLYTPLFKKRKIVNDLFVSRMITIFWAVMLVLSALFFMNSPQSVVELALSIASFTYGGLLGTFLLGLINMKADQSSALFGFIFSICVMLIVVITNFVAWTWFTFIGVIVTVTVGSLYRFITSKINPD